MLIKFLLIVYLLCLKVNSIPNTGSRRLETTTKTTKTTTIKNNNNNKIKCDLKLNTTYNDTYPLSPIKKHKNNITLKIGIITDRDRASRVGNYSWASKVKKGYLTFNPKRLYRDTVKIEWENESLDITLKTDLSAKGRSMEMSELIVFNGELYTCDDRTGMVYKLKNGGNNTYIFVRLNDGDGTQEKGMKCEWMTVKDKKLYVGSVGMEWVFDNGTIIHNNTFWIKTIDTRGVVENINWVNNYNALRNSINFTFPGYLYHESAVWFQKSSSWYFMPRKGSNLKYNSTEDETRGLNSLLIANENFTKITRKFYGNLNKTRGFSSFKLIPETYGRGIVALKTVEVGKIVESYICAFNHNGKYILNETFIGNEKYEGIEFI